MELPRRASRASPARFLYHCMWFLLVSATPAEADPIPFEATYRADFKGLPITAKALRSLEKRKDGRYVLTSEAHSFLANVTERSVFRWDGEEVIPLQYEYVRKGLGRNRDETVHFDADARDATRGDNRGPSWVSIDRGVTDTLNYQLQMREDVARAVASGSNRTRFTYRIADGNRIKEYSFEIQGEELLKTHVGNLRTLRLARVDGSAKRETIFWLARDWQYLLVRLKQTENGSGSFDLLLDSATMGDKRVKPFAE